jgi:hypothetical protein
LQPDGKGLAAANSELKFSSSQSEHPDHFPATGPLKCQRKDGQTMAAKIKTRCVADKKASSNKQQVISHHSSCLGI